MKIVSIDIGIKNLAIIVLEDLENNKIKILDWNIINLCNHIPNCSCCKKIAKYSKKDKYFCKQHTNNSNYKIPEIEFKNLSKQNIKTLFEFADKLNIEYDKTISKNNLIKLIEDTKEELYLEKIEPINSNNLNLIDIGINLKNELNKLFMKIDLQEIDMVIIENQISPIANRMKTLQGMVAQYFINCNIYDIEFISSINKLKLFCDNKKTNYAERKKLSINYTKEFLFKNNMNEEYEFLNKHIKKDDLCDCFLQGIYFLNKLNKITIY